MILIMIVIIHNNASNNKDSRLIIIFKRPSKNHYRKGTFGGRGKANLRITAQVLSQKKKKIEMSKKQY